MNKVNTEEKGRVIFPIREYDDPFVARRLRYCQRGCPVVRDIGVLFIESRMKENFTYGLTRGHQKRGTVVLPRW